MYTYVCSYFQKSKTNTKDFIQLADKLQIKSITPQYEIIDRTNCLDALVFSNDPKSKEIAMTLTLNKFETIGIEYAKLSYIHFFISVSVEQNTRLSKPASLHLD